tara:strand:+ start:139 stop:360 length:222 start_codon:yes stop_codon:yes gene_type:complete
MSDDILVGYVRKSNSYPTLRLSINLRALEDCKTYTTSDGQTYIQLEIDIRRIQTVINGERAITIITQKGDEEE